MSLINVNTDLKVIDCWACGIMFAVPCSFNADLESVPQTFYCPKGCRLRYGEPSWKKELRAAKDSERFYREQSERNKQRADSAKKRLSATRGVVTRLKNRASKGICPCCNRHFTNLQRHMENKHPDFVESK